MRTFCGLVSKLSAKLNTIGTYELKFMLYVCILLLFFMISWLLQTACHEVVLVIL